MKDIVLFTTTVTGFVLTTVVPAMADITGGFGGGFTGGRSAPTVEIGSGLLGNAAALVGMSVVLLMLFRRRSRI